MQSTRKTIHLIIGQVMFFVLFFWYFLQYSFLRPSVDKNIDCIIALFLIAVMAINFWLLHPFINKKYSFYIYLLISLVESLIINIVEYVMTLHVILSLYSDVIHQYGKTTAVLLPIYCNTFFRDYALLVFVGLVADNIRLVIKGVESDQELLRSKNQLVAKYQGKICVIDLAPIYLCRQERNYAMLYSIDGQIYKKRISLKDLDDLLRGKGFVRISKSDIIRLSSIKKCENNIIFLINEIVTKTKTIIIGKSFIESAVPIILQFLQTKSEVELTTKKSEENRGQTFFLKQQNEPNRTKAVKIQQYISAHQNCKLDEIVVNTKIPKSTTTRYLKEMQQQGFIKYVGSKKTGGYRVISG